MLLHVVAISSSIALSMALTWVICRIAMRLGWVSRPIPDRMPVSPTPILGGTAIFLAFLLCAGILGNFRDPMVALLIWTAAAAYVLGTIDDFCRLSPRWKLFGQVVIGLIFLSFAPAVSLTGVRLLDLLIAAVWIIGITNAFNLLDNINGLCGGTAVLVGVFQGAHFFISGNEQLGWLSIGFAGAICGFLVFNFPSGRIFMGDSGSMLVGFWLASTTLTGVRYSHRNHITSTLFPLLIMIVPICDTTLVTLTRMLRRRPISLGGTDHLSHRLVAYGFSKRDAVLALWCVSLLMGVVALLTLIYGAFSLVSTVALLVVAVAIVGVYLTRFELRPPSIASETASRPLHSPKWLQLGMQLSCDAILAVAAYYTAYLLRFDSMAQSRNMVVFYDSVLQLLIIKVTVFVALGAYRRWWQYFGLKDALRIGFASAVASLTVIAYFAAAYRLYNFSRIVFALDFLAFTLLAISVRFSFRLFDSFAPTNHRVNVVIYGADDEGETTLHFVAKHYPIRVIGFLDADEAKRNLMIHSIPVRGDLTHLLDLTRDWNVKAVLLSSCLGPDETARLQTECRRLGIELLRLRFELEELAGSGTSLWKELAPGERIPSALVRPEVATSLVSAAPRPEARAMSD